MNLRNLTFRGKPVYYGWIIVTGFGLVTMVSMGMLGINFGLFIDPMSREMNISQAFFGWAQSGRILGSAVSGLILGRLLDRYGARWLMAVAGVLVAGALLLMANINAGWQIVAIFVLMGLIGLQGGGGNLYTQVSVSNWFIRKRSHAMSRVFLGTSIGILVFAPLTAYLIDHIGWRETIVLLGLTGGVVVIIVALLVRRNPKEIGQPMDGDFAHPVGSDLTETDRRRDDSDALSGEYSWTRKEAVRSSAFWKLSLAFGLAMFANGTTQLFRVPYYISRGIDAQTVAFSLSFEAVIVFIIVIPVGYLAGRFNLRYLLIISLVIRVGVILIMFATTEAWQAFLANGLFGISATSQMILMSIIWPNYFGRANIGSIRGLAMPIMTSLSFAGAPVAGIIFDINGTYALAWVIAIIFAGVSSLLFLITPKPVRPAHVRAD